MRWPFHILFFIGLLPLSNAQPIVVYSTDFDDFPLGSDAWSGTEGWIGTDDASGVYGIDSDATTGLGKTGYLGSRRPTQAKVIIIKTIPIAPIQENIGVTSFRTLAGVQDSSNGYRDSFTFTVYNRVGQPMGGIRFDNRNEKYGIWRHDGQDLYHTGTSFLRGELYDLQFDISYAENKWSALLDGIPLFTDEAFTRNNVAGDFGGIGLEWRIGTGDPATHGNNWILVADWEISTSHPLADNVNIISWESILEVKSGAELPLPPGEEWPENDDDKAEGETPFISAIQWRARVNAMYRVETSVDLLGDWVNIHGPFQAIAGENIIFVPVPGIPTGNLYFRIVRNP